jgi:hypothetical protein
MTIRGALNGLLISSLIDLVEEYLPAIKVDPRFGTNRLTVTRTINGHLYIDEGLYPEWIFNPDGDDQLVDNPVGVWTVDLSTVKPRRIILKEHSVTNAFTHKPIPFTFSYQRTDYNWKNGKPVPL